MLGRFQSVRNEVQVENAQARGIEIVRRISGGGAMFIEPEGAITYSLYAPAELAVGMSFAESYAFFDSWVIDVLLGLGIDAWYEPLNDITSSGGKIGGAAQARKYGAVLHHTTMAYDMSPGLIGDVLRIGQEKLSDKGIRSADKRVGPLRQQTNLPRDEIIERLVDHFAFMTAAQDGRLSDEERAITEGSYYMIGPVPDAAKALAAYEQLLARDSTNRTALNNAGIIYHDTYRRFDKSSALFSLAVNHASASPQAYVALQSALIDVGRPPASLTAF